MVEGENSPRREVIPAEGTSEAPSAKPDLPLPVELKALVELEHARIRSADQRTAMMEKAFDVVDAQDKRQYDFHKSNADQMHAAQREKFSFARKVTYWILGAGGVVLGLSLWMSFWGTESQAATARELLTTALFLLTGVGLAALGRLAFRHLGGIGD